MLPPAPVASAVRSAALSHALAESWAEVEKYLANRTCCVSFTSESDDHASSKAHFATRLDVLRVKNHLAY